MAYKLCPECDAPILKKGQKRKHPDEYRHATGCPLIPKRERPHYVKLWGKPWSEIVKGNVL